MSSNLDPETFMLVRSAAKEHGVDPSLVMRVIAQESGGRADALSPKGARGLMQLMPGTAADMGVTDPNDPAQNINGGVKYLSQMLKRYGGDTNKALAAYNAGPGNVDSGKAFAFPETKNYVASITKDMPTKNVMDPDEFMAARKVKQPEPAPLKVAPKTEPEKAPESSGGLLGFGKSILNSVIDTVKHPVENAPVIGGMVGSLAGGGKGPLAMGTAALGGAAGQGYKELFSHLSELPGALKDVIGNAVSHPSETLHGFKEGAIGGAKDAGIQGAIQGATEVGGRAIGGGLKILGKAAVKHAVNPTALMLAKNPNLITDIIQSGVNVSKKGLAKAGNIVSDLSDKTTAKIADAWTHQQGRFPITIQEVLQGLDTLKSQQQTGQMVRSPKLARIADYEAQALADNPSGVLSWPSADVMKTGEQKAARKIYDAGAKGMPVDDFQAELHAGVADGLKTSLENRVPAVKDMNTATGKAIEVEDALQKALQYHSTKPVSWLKHGLAGGLGSLGAFALNPALGVGAALGTEILGNPAVESSIGRKVFNAGRLPYSQILRLLEMAGNDSK